LDIIGENRIESHPSPQGEGKGVRLYPISERAVTLEFGDTINLDTHKNIMQYQSCLHAANMPGFIECVPAYTSLTVYFDLLKVHQSKLMGESALQKVSSFLRSIVVDTNSNDHLKKRINVPVCYDKEFGLDLVELSQTKNISIDDLIHLHVNKDYTVYMIGFTPGFPYMGEIDERLVCSRKANPRKIVPAGSVAIAGKQTGIYPFDTPGGWQIIGRTPTQLFSSEKNPPAQLQAGMLVKFVPITRQEFDTLNKA
jgi:inhibitor of KinA